MTTILSNLAELNSLLGNLDRDACAQEFIDKALTDNPWFTREEIYRAIGAIRECMLSAPKAEQWIASYPALATPHAPRNIGIIMAGNIPLVGFFDLLCVLASGNKAYIKPSSKDSALMDLAGLLIETAGGKDCIYKLQDNTPLDAIIATGGDSANIYFQSRYADLPHLLRGSRHSAAVLAGNESEAELAGLADDIFLYSGLGCRSVSLVFVPRGYRLCLPSRAMCAGYRNNYRQTRAMLTMSGTPFEDNGAALFVRSDAAEFPKQLSRINIAEYDDIASVREWLHGNDARLQCVASSIGGLHPRTVPLGRTQYPELTDYADNADVMAFLQSVVGA